MFHAPYSTPDHCKKFDLAQFSISANLSGYCLADVLTIFFKTFKDALKMNLEFHHIGIPVDKSRMSENARYSSLFKMYTEDAKNSIGIHIQYHAFEDGSPLREIIRNQPHVAFKTEKIEFALEGKHIVMPLYEPFKGYRCAMILLNNVPIEFIETNLSEKELWNDEETLKNGLLYDKT